MQALRSLLAATAAAARALVGSLRFRNDDDVVSAAGLARSLGQHLAGAHGEADGVGIVADIEALFRHGEGSHAFLSERGIGKRKLQPCEGIGVVDLQRRD